MAIINGTSGNETLNGTIGDDIINGKGGKDGLIGDLGNDIYEFSEIFSGTFPFNSDYIVEATIGGNDSIHILTGSSATDIPVNATVRLAGGTHSSYPNALGIFVDGYGTIFIGDHLLQANVESLKIGNNAPISLTGGITMTGSAGDETVRGTNFNDTINGKEGKDGLVGGLGDDVYQFSGLFSGSFPFNSDYIVETIVGGKDSIHILTGNNLADIPTSTTVRLAGGTHSSYPDALGIFVDGYGTIFIGDHLLQANVESLKIGNNVPISLTSGLSMIGSISSETIRGTKFSDTINGKGGSDSLRGGLGNDTYIVDNVGVVITENLNEGTDTVKSSISYTLPLNVENLTLTGTLAINGTGNDLNNVLIGNSAINQLNGGLGNDTLNGGASADNLIGGLGNDNYVVDNAGDVVTENLNEGTDRISSSITRTLSANVENLTLTGTTAINGSGNGLANILIGNSAINQLNGGGGNDTLDGGTGNNVLTGGAGQDIFRLTTAGHIDAITDFVVVDDTIQLENAVFTALATPGTLAAGQLRIGAQALDANDFIIYNNATGALLYDANGNGAGAAVQIATLSAGLAVTNADFVVI